MVQQTLTYLRPGDLGSPSPQVGSATVLVPPPKGKLGHIPLPARGRWEGDTSSCLSFWNLLWAWLPGREAKMGGDMGARASC